jgi:hypothetical protein
MRTKWGILSAALSLVATSAMAQEVRSSEADPATPSTADSSEGRATNRPPAPMHAFELGIDGGYTQPFGNIDPSRPITNLADAGGAVGLTIGGRLGPHWSLGAYGQYHESTADPSFVGGTRARGVVGGILATYHILPYGMLNPYVSLGGGYRALFMLPPGPNNNETLHGLEAGRALVGVDFRVSKDIAFGPQVGATVDLFYFDDLQSAPVFFVESARPTTFIFAGAAARFDIGGARVHQGETATPAAAPAECRPVVPSQ